MRSAFLVLQARRIPSLDVARQVEACGESAGPAVAALFAARRLDGVGQRPRQLFEKLHHGYGHGYGARRGAGGGGARGACCSAPSAIRRGTTLPRVVPSATTHRWRSAQVVLSM